MPNTFSLSGKKAELADLYFESGTVKFGAFKIAAHETLPNLPLSPLYMHYPKEDEPGCEMLPKIYKLIGELFAEIIQAEQIKFTKLCAVPRGADPLAVQAAKALELSDELVLTFDKRVINGKRTFSGPTSGEVSNTDTILVLDDHTSTGYSKTLFIDYLESLGATVSDVLTVVDRQQGATEYLESRNVTMYSIITISTLVDYYLAQGLITQDQVTAVGKYLAQAQVKL
ncbi:hypothetical protein KC973_01680 [Candidatus Saccharibacteria bacterium]|nr:hypothetical protein [Candidatus Saccharibacteria bacterium]